MFPDIRNRAIKEMAAGVRVRTFWGDNLMLMLVEFEPHAAAAAHSHPHEQAGVVLSGEVTFVIAGESRVLHAGDLYLIPGGSQHSVEAGSQPVRLLDIFSPVREDLKY